ncbi:2-dehydro-3-deoxygalactonokinase [Limimaricola hongkongensis]|uniref:2-dehydro-3-deoxygalactonokinase n=1 Tax=Limimaricola hongkongensis DSM 17492 TaxID=1122180 RepID=A0A017HAD8_9RHOB|nr:2-dehydro-3-deoxygalactonokinase [Limimaricola hongkongensis]EYD70754.1 2-dehydro-3-deoxygalactonokinase [Limimaricola hongkongensis DSM 17492]
MSAPDWIALDWGTTHLRGWAMRRDGTVIEERGSPRGMGTLAPDGFEPALREMCGDWLDGDPVPIIACGMVGAKQGWVEAAYASVPCPPLSGALTAAPGRLDAWIIPGLSQSGPADVMRGEETQVAGFLALNPGWDGVLCLPGSHSKWAHLSAGEVVSFRSFMTGELYAALSQHSVLRHSVQGEGWDEAAFDDGVAETLSRPERLASALFTIRAADLLEGRDSATARARLSGLLIGAELAAAKPYWLGQQIGVIGAGGLAGLYVRALGAQGAPATQANATAVTLAGLTAAWKQRTQA